MRRTRRTSNRYRGSRGGVGILIPSLVVLCIAAAVALYFINNNMTFTRDGAFFDIPQKERPQSAATGSIVIEGSTSDDDKRAEASAQQTDTPQEKKAVKGYFIPIESTKSIELFEAALSEIPTDAEINTVMLEVKAEDGTLAFASDSPLAENSGVSGDDEMLISIIAGAKEKGYEVALYMSCFRDNETARTNASCAARTAKKSMWRDANDIRWLSAYSDDAKEYLASLIKKLNSFEPDEIILSNISFPAIGKPEILSYDKTLGTKQEMLADFISKAKTAAGDTKISAVYENYDAKRIEYSGQAIEDFTGFDAVYVNALEGKYTLGIESVKEAIDSAECEFVVIAEEPQSDAFMIRK